MDVNHNAPVLATSEIMVEAPVEVVWNVLADIRNWSEWNPSVSAVSMYGEFEPQTEFRWKAEGVTMLSTLQKVQPQQLLLWTGRTPGIRATHLWLFDEMETGTRVRTEECFEGLLARLLKGPLNNMLAASLERGLQCLKKESERRHQTAGD